jgi:hypothetical protein
MTTELKPGDLVTTSRTVLKPGHTRKNGEVVPDRTVTTMREGKLLRAIMVGPRACQVGGWIVEWRDSANRKRTDTFFSHEVSKVGSAPLLLKAAE